LKIARFLYDHLELLVWAGGLVFLATWNPYTGPSFDLCLFHRLGLPCPGCGLGRSISFVLHGDLSRSLHTHPLGVFALVVLVIRSVSLLPLRRGVSKSLPGTSTI